MGKRREDWVDALKGIGTILVVIVHCHHTPVVLDIWAGIYVIPLFFIASGFFVNSRGENSQWIRKRAAGLLGPYFIYAICFWLILMLWNAVKMRTFRFDTDGFLAIFLQMQGTKWRSPSWFLCGIFLAQILFRRLLQITGGDEKKVMIWSTAATVCGMLYPRIVPFYLPWNFDVAVAVQVFLAIGWLAWNKGFFRNYRSSKLLPLLLMAAGTAAGFINYAVGGVGIDYHARHYNEIVTCAASAIFLTMGTALLCCKFPCPRWLVFVGKNSLLYYLLQKVGTSVGEKVIRFAGISELPAIVLTMFIVICALIIPVPLIVIINWTKKKIAGGQ